MENQRKLFGKVVLLKTMRSPEENQDLSLKNVLRKTENHYWGVFQVCRCIYNDSFLQKKDGNVSLKNNSNEQGIM